MLLNKTLQRLVEAAALEHVRRQRDDPLLHGSDVRPDMVREHYAALPQDLRRSVRRDDFEAAIARQLKQWAAPDR
jgi:hypothetical protein